MIMNLEDYVIGICFDKSGEVYWSVTKKGKLHYCNKEELKMVSEVLNLLRKRIDNFTGELKEVDIIKWAKWVHEKD